MIRSVFRVLLACFLMSGVLVVQASPAFAVPGNDDFTQATTIAGGGATLIAESNVDATAETGEPDHAGIPGGTSVWYSWTAPSTDVVVVHTSAEFCDLLAVYTGSAVNSLTEVAGSAGCGLSLVEFTPVASTTYRIAVDGDSAVSGSFDLSLQQYPRPANDDFGSPTVLTGAPTSRTGDVNIGSSIQAGEPDHGGLSGTHSVWYSWTAPATALAKITTDSDFCDILAVYTGATVGSLTPVAGDPGCGASVVSFAATAGTTYRIAISTNGSGLEWGTINQLRVATMANDSFANSLSLGTGAADRLRDFNDGATKEVGEPDHGGDPGGSSVWYSWTATSTDLVRVTLEADIDFCGSVGVYTGSAVNSLTPVGSSAPCAAGVVSFTGTPSTTYRIAVDDDGFGSGDFDLHVDTFVRPSNDDFGSATVLTGVSALRLGETTDPATREVGEPDHASAGGSNSVWYRWTAPATGGAYVGVGSEGSCSVVAVYTGSAVSALTPVASEGSLCGQNIAYFRAQATTTYRIAVDTDGTGAGPFDLELAVVPNDDFLNATVVTGAPVHQTGDKSVGATKEAGEPTHAAETGENSVWYSWTAPATGRATVETDSDFCDVVAVYTGVTVGGLTPVAGDSTVGCGFSTATFAAESGQTYHIAIDGKYPQEWGNIAFDITLLENDDFADAKVLTGTSANLAAQTSLNATHESGEPDHAGAGGVASVWYSWTAPTGGLVQIKTVTDFCDVLAVYTGSAVGGLTPVTSDPGCSESLVTFTAVSGTTYRIAVDGDGVGEWGTFSLDLLQDSGLGGSIIGTVYDTTISPGNLVSGASVSACPVAGPPCFYDTTSASGNFEITGVPIGNYRITVEPPLGSSLERTILATTISMTFPQQTSAGNIILKKPTPLPSGSTITNRGTVADGVPIVGAGQQLTLTTEGCSGSSPAATYAITIDGAITPIRSGPMTEGPAGHYTATVQPLNAPGQQARVVMTLNCPTTTIEFNIYIDPSGYVRTTAAEGGEGITGATVTLYRSVSAGGPFTVVADGSTVMSHANRANPDTTDSEGHFGWDVTAGYYKVRAEKNGCHAPADSGQVWVESAVMTIPPPVTDLDLRLQCGPVGTNLSIKAPSKVRPGAKAKITGVLGSALAACSNTQTVDLKKGTATIASQTTTTGGGYTFIVKIKRKTTLQVAFAGTDSCSASLSAKKTIGIK